MYNSSGLGYQIIKNQHMNLAPSQQLLCSSSHSPEKYITLYFFPSTITSLLQPMDQGLERTSLQTDQKN